MRQNTKKQRVNFIDLIEQEEKSLDELLNACFKFKPDNVQGCVEGMISTVCAENLKIECRVCNKKLPTNSDFVLHYVDQQTISCMCTFCGKVNSSYRNSWNHILKHMSSIKEDTIGDKTKAISSLRRFTCCICRKHFNSHSLRTKHILQHLVNTSKQIVCLVCNNMIEGSEELLSHCTLHDELENILKESSSSSKNSDECTRYLQKSSKRYKCDLCSVQCWTPSSLKAHNRIHTDERPFVCEECNKSFKRFQALKLHIQVVHFTEIQSHGCPLCPMKFRLWSSLLRHFLRLHKQFRRYVCGLCGNRYSQNQDLKGHFKKHHNLTLPNIKSTEKKAVNDVYVIPALNENDPLAIKIEKIVTEEKQKLNGVVEFLKGNQKPVQSDKTKNNSSGSQYIPKNYSNDSSEAKMTVTNDNSKEINSLYVGQTIESLQNKIFQCYFCHQTFLELADCQKHLQRRSLYFCKDCNINFCDEQSNYLHGLLKHNIIMNKCDICEQSFVTKELLLQHLPCCKNSSISRNIDYALVVTPTILKTFNDNTNGILIKDENSCITLNETASNSDTSTVLKSYEDEFQMCIENTQSLNFIKEINFDKSQQENLQFPVQKLVLPIYFDPLSIKTTASGNSSTADSSNNFEILENNEVMCHMEGTIGKLNRKGILPVTAIHSSSASEETISYITINDKSNIIDEDNTGRVIVIETAENSILNLPIVNPPGETKKPLDRLATETITSSRISETDKTLYETCEVIRVENWLHRDPTIAPPTLSERFSRNSEDFKKSVKYQDTDLGECCSKSEIHNNLYCAKCHISFTDSDSFAQHVKRHNVVRPYICDVCDKHFACKPYLKTHKYKHTGERPYTCGECGKGLRYPADLAEHIRKHFKLKPFECCECGKKFTRQYDLRRHLAIHSQRKRYKCPICEKSFHRLDALKSSHLRTHDDKSQQVMYTCTICDKKYTSINILKRHQILHCGKTFKCHLCDKSFSHKAYFNPHVRRHANKKEYLKCTKCLRKFISEDTLKKHEASFHCELAKKKQKCALDAHSCRDIRGNKLNSNQLSELDGKLKANRNALELINKMLNVNNNNNNDDDREHSNITVPKEIVIQNLEIDDADFDRKHSNTNFAKETEINNLETNDVTFMNAQYIIGDDIYNSPT